MSETPSGAPRGPLLTRRRVLVGGAAAVTGIAVTAWKVLETLNETEADRLCRRFPNELPGAGRIERAVEHPGSSILLAAVRQRHRGLGEHNAAGELESNQTDIARMLQVLHDHPQFQLRTVYLENMASTQEIDELRNPRLPLIDTDQRAQIGVAVTERDLEDRRGELVLATTDADR